MTLLSVSFKAILKATNAIKSQIHLLLLLYVKIHILSSKYFVRTSLSFAHIAAWENQKLRKLMFFFSFWTQNPKDLK